MQCLCHPRAFSGALRLTRRAGSTPWRCAMPQPQRGTVQCAAAAGATSDEESSGGGAMPRRRRRKHTTISTPAAAAAPSRPRPPPPFLARRELQQQQQGPRSQQDQQQPQQLEQQECRGSVGIQFGPAPTHPAFDSVAGWVVFSDLHVSHKTLDSALQVLDQVHREAQQRQAGVLFLGDFWDRRGDLPVVPLNRIQEHLSSWTVPLLMLPGNHDQVDLGGMHHSLAPLQLAAAAAHVFTQPTLYRGSLWMPYRRGESSVRDTIAVASSLAASSSGGSGGRLKAIFGHADVQSAHYNASYQARDGLPPSLFPAAIPVFLGHYHFPHTVEGTAITYVGSPYQVSWSEAGQQKRLLLLDTDWQMTGQVPLDIGRRFHSFTAAGNAAATAVAAAPGHEGSGGKSDSCSGAEDEAAALAATAAEAGAAASSSSSSDSTGPTLTAEVAQGLVAEGVLRPGDVVRLAAAEEGDGEVLQLQQLLRQQGVQVQLQLQPPARAAARIQSAEQLTMRELLEVYAANTRMPPEATTLAQATLQELGGQSCQSPQHSHLELHSLVVEGFGPFKSAVHYPLADRGVVAVTGRNQDDASTVSNGAGKTSLLTALLWAFKAPDGRGMTRADYINEDSSRAEVTVTGRINEEPFRVVRTATRTQSSLTLTVGGRDLTSQEQRLTQEELEARFSASLLPKTLVFSQEDLLSLLQSNDAAFKAMLSSIVDTNSWANAKDAASAQRTKADRAAVAAAALTSQLQADVAAGQQRLQQLQEQQRHWEEQQQQKKEHTQQTEQLAANDAFAAAGDAAAVLQQLGAALAAVREQQHELTTEQEAAAAAAATAATEAASQQQAVGPQQQQQPSALCQQQLAEFDMAAAAAELAPLQQAERQAQQDLQQQQAATQQLLGQLQAAKACASRYRQSNSSSSSSSSRAGVAAAADLMQQPQQTGGLKPVCEQCLQPINVKLYEKNLLDMAAAQQSLEQQIAEAESTEQQLAAALAAATAARQRLEQQQSTAASAVAVARERALADIAAQQRAAAAEQQRLRQLEQQAAEQRRLQQQQLFDRERRLREQLSKLQQVLQHISTATSQLDKALKAAANRLDMPQLLVLQAAATTTAASAATVRGDSSELAAAASRLCQQAEQLCDALDAAVERVSSARAELRGLAGMQNPYSASVQQWRQQVEQQQGQLEAKAAESEQLQQQVKLWRHVILAFGRTGIPSFLLEDVLGELQAATSRHLAELAAGMSLTLSATSAKRSASKAGKTGAKKGRKAAVAAATSAPASLEDDGSGSDADDALSPPSSAAKEEVSKVVFVRAAGGELRQRSIAQLSGGEKKRLALALGLGFAEVVAARARLTSNCLILDEVLEKLDGEGCSRVAALLKRLPYRSVFVVGQAGSFVTNEFAAVDTVVKAGGASTVQLDGRGLLSVAA